MPPLPSVPNTLRVDLHQSIGPDVLALSRLYFEYSGGPPTAADCVALANDVVTSYNAHLAAFVSSGGGTHFPVVTDIASSTGAQGVATTNSSGTRTGGGNPNNVCALITHQIARRYRGGKPRTYLGAGTMTDVSTGESWASGFVSGLQTAYAAFIAAIIGATSGSTTITAYVNVSYFQGVNPPVTLPSGRVKQSSKLRAGGPVVDAITGSTVSSIPGSQRRRLQR